MQGFLRFLIARKSRILEPKNHAILRGPEQEKSPPQPQGIVRFLVHSEVQIGVAFRSHSRTLALTTKNPLCEKSPLCGRPFYRNVYYNHCITNLGLNMQTLAKDKRGNKGPLLSWTRSCASEPTEAATSKLSMLSIQNTSAGVFGAY